MRTNHITNAAILPTQSLRVPESYHAGLQKVQDDILRNSIALTGIQQPLVVARLEADGSEYFVIDGVRRLRAGR